MLRLLETIGRKALLAAATLRAMAGLAGLCGVRGLMPGTYNPAVRRVVTRQIYFTAVQVLPLFLSVALAFGTGVVGSAVAGLLHLNLADQAGRLVVDLLILEFAPLMTALFVGLRSGAAINAEMATMVQTGELRTLELFGIERATYLLLPRLIATVVAVTLLTGIFALVVITSAYLALFLFVQTGITAYMAAVIDALTAQVAILLLAKSLILGFLVALIPFYSGLYAPPAMTGIPVAVLHGMVRLFLALFLVELLTLGMLWL